MFPKSARCAERTALEESENIMFGFHAWDLLIVLLIVLLLFGARRLPELGSSLGQSYKMLQKGLNGSSQPDADEQESEQNKQVDTPKENTR
jgi:sec-independent protein translocase protein TatA